MWMNMKTFLWSVLLWFGLMFGFISTASAELQSRLNGQAVYDTDLDITWLADANAGGLMNLTSARSWVSNLSVDGVTGWRLPSFPVLANGGVCVGSCSESEMGHLFYTELSGTSGQPIQNSPDPDLALFSNIQQQYYWSVGVQAPRPGVFHFGRGIQVGTYRTSRRYGVWAVHDGDVGGATNNDCLMNCLQVNSISLTNALSEIRSLVVLTDEAGSAAGARGATVHVIWTRPDGSTVDQYTNIGTRLRASFRTPVVAPGSYKLTVVGATKTDYTFDPANSNLIFKTIVVGDQPNTAKIGDYVWSDANGDGLQGLNETGVASVPVHLQDCNGTVLASLFTDSQGKYEFVNLASGRYQLKFDLLLAYKFSPKNVGGDVQRDSDVDRATGLTDCISLANDTVRFDTDAGLIPDMPAVDHLSILKAVYKSRRHRLEVKAHSDALPTGSAQLTAIMVVNGVETELGLLQWNRRKGYYKLKFNAVTVAPDTKKVVSDQGGVVTGTVKIK